MRTLRVETPRVFAPLLQPCRYKGAWGGRGSGKSTFFAELLIERCLMQPATRAVCVREYQRSLDQSVKRLLEDVIARWGVGYAFRILNTHIETRGEGRIIFHGLATHTADSIKSLEGYDIAWVEEAQTLSQRSLDILRPTIRKPGSELWFSWNPNKATDPVDAFLRGDQPPPDGIVIETSYRDNPWLPPDLRAEVEWDQARDPDKFAHIWLGQYLRRSEARVFRNWRVADEPIVPPEGTAFYFGADWGYSVDPTVLVRCWVAGRTLYVDREVYQIGCEIDRIPALFDTLEHGQAREWLIVADSARPETIAYLRRHGYPRMEPARKGPGSVEEGVAFLQSYDIVVDPACRHTIDELTLYSYKTDRLTGEVIPVLEDKQNHVIDCLRYGTERIRRPHEPLDLLFVEPEVSGGEVVARAIRDEGVYWPGGG